MQAVNDSAAAADSLAAAMEGLQLQEASQQVCVCVRVQFVRSEAWSAWDDCEATQAETIPT